MQQPHCTRVPETHGDDGPAQLWGGGPELLQGGSEGPGGGPGLEGPRGGGRGLEGPDGGGPELEGPINGGPGLEGPVSRGPGLEGQVVGAGGARGTAAGSGGKGGLQPVCRVSGWAERWALSTVS